MTWFRLGGPAEYLLAPESEEQLATMIRRCRESGMAVRFLGLGANVIVPDAGVSGAVVRLDAPAFTTITNDGSRMIAGAGVDLTKLVRKAVRDGLAGLENIAGIPGTVGGGICMNCGGRYGEIGTAVKRIRVIGSDGRRYERDHDDLEFGYRHCALGSDCIVSAEFNLEPMDRSELEMRFREIYLYKQNTQPPLGAQSVGCIFRNPTGRSAGEIIDRAGLKGCGWGVRMCQSGMRISVLADPGGRATDVIELIRLIGQRVEDHCGIRLEPEVKIWWTGWTSIKSGISGPWRGPTGTPVLV